MLQKRVAILGGGASGLISIKACLEEGMQVTCFELQEKLGGLWRFRDDDVNGLASVMRSTIINSSKEMSAFSDFPPPVNFPNYMHNSYMIKYIELYAEHFDLAKHILFQHEVLSVERAPDFDKTSRWLVKVRDLATNNEFEEEFDGVMICTGHHVFPKAATFEGQEKFQGDIVHTHTYKKPAGYEDKKVLVVGVGNSGGDVAVELSQVAEQVYLSTRRGCWIIHRVGPNGLPFDAEYIRRNWNVLFKIIPFDIKSSLTERYINSRFDHDLYNLKPKHRIFGQHPMVNDALPNRILSGTVAVKSNIKRFTPTGVIFEGEEEREYAVDRVVLATGYDIKFPYLSKDIVNFDQNKCELYKYVFIPKAKYHSLAFIGLAQSVGPLFPISEIQARWFAQVIAEKVRMPSPEAMMADIRNNDLEMAKRYFEGPRNTIQLDWLPYMDDVAQHFGAKPKMSRLLLTDPRLFWACFWGPCVPYQYRLNGPHVWSGARDAILSYPQRVMGAFNTRKTTAADQHEEQHFRLVRFLLAFLLVALLAFLVTAVV